MTWKLPSHLEPYRELIDLPKFTGPTTAQDIHFTLEEFMNYYPRDGVRSLYVQTPIDLLQRLHEVRKLR